LLGRSHIKYQTHRFRLYAGGDGPRWIRSIPMVNRP
jgi:hypothetical protein